MNENGVNLIILGNFIVFVVLFAFFYVYVLKEKGYVNKDNQPIKKFRFRFFHFYNEDNLFLVYVYLSLGMMRQDRSELRTQQSLLIKKLKRRFGSWTNKEITEYYLEILKGFPEVDYYYLYHWMNKKSNEREKIQLLDILTDLAYHNDVVTRAEFRFLYNAAEKLHVSAETIRSLIAIRQSRLEAHQERNSPQFRAINKEAKIKQKLHVLGLNNAKTQDEIRAAYRKLVKIYHPDRFATKSKDEQEMAHERFIEIKAAHDFLLEHL